ncbi:MAG TPA: YtxH domain-containing protein [Candidatus Saccharimonadales bacterium]|nr:YtxH domain-containing protein [Candidatus Saccharimonadales bacterium]
MSKSRGFIKGTLIGAAIGSVAAILLAPKSGKETQADIKRKVGTFKRDIDKVVDDMHRDLMQRIDDLKDAAKDLKGEAYEESQELIARAELMKQDLQASAGNLAKSGSKVKDDALLDAKRLVDEGAGVMAELERLTKKMVGSAKDKVRRPKTEETDSIL